MLNNVTLMGRMAADPVLRHTHTSNIPVAGFPIAVNRRFSKDAKEQIADFFNIVAWQGTADFVTKNFKKGQPICVKGRLQQRSWVDEATGVTRYTVEVVAESVYFAGFMREDGPNTAAVQGEENFDPYADDLPMAA